MVESTVNALTSTSAPKKAMTRTREEVGKIRLRSSTRDFFRAWRRKCAFRSKIGVAVASPRGNCRPGSSVASQRAAVSELITAARASASASLRSVRTERGEECQNLHGGNDARWKTPKTSFPPRLEIREKAPDSHIPTVSAAAFSLSLKLSRGPPHLIR